jgi:hypothetical protein
MSFSAKRCAYCPRPSFSSQSATLAYADVPISTRVNKPKKSLQRLRWFDFHRHLIRQATKRQSKRGNALGLVSRDSFYSVPPGRRLWEAVYNLARMLASDRRLTWAAGSMPSKKCDLGQVRLLGTSLLPVS